MGPGRGQEGVIRGGNGKEQHPLKFPISRSGEELFYQSLLERHCVWSVTWALEPLNWESSPPPATCS